MHIFIEAKLKENEWEKTVAENVALAKTKKRVRRNDSWAWNDDDSSWWNKKKWQKNWKGLGVRGLSVLKNETKASLLWMGSNNTDCVGCNMPCSPLVALKASNVRLITHMNMTFPNSKKFKPLLHFFFCLNLEKPRWKNHMGQCSSKNVVYDWMVNLT